MGELICSKRKCCILKSHVRLNPLQSITSNSAVNQTHYCQHHLYNPSQILYSFIKESSIADNVIVVPSYIAVVASAEREVSRSRRAYEELKHPSFYVTVCHSILSEPPYYQFTLTLGAVVM